MSRVPVTMPRRFLSRSAGRCVARTSGIPFDDHLLATARHLGKIAWERIARDARHHVVASQTIAVLHALRLDLSQRAVTYQARLDCPSLATCPAAGDLAGQIYAFDVTEQLLRRLTQALQEIDEGSSVRHPATLKTGCTNGGAGSVGAGGTDDEGATPGDE